MQVLSLSSFGNMGPTTGPIAVHKFNTLLPAEPTGTAPSSGGSSRVESFGPLGVGIWGAPAPKFPGASAAVSTGASASAGSSSASSSSSAASASKAAASTAVPIKAASGGASQASSATASAASSILEDELDSSYSTTVGGTQYAGLVGQSGGEYTASVASVLGATGSGSTELAAENNLNTRIDELV